MAQYSITHACGHEQTHAIYGTSRERERKQDWLATTDCADCYRKQLEAGRQAQTEAAKSKAEEYGMAALDGTEKQAAWAERIRKSFLDALTDGEEHDRKRFLDALLRGGTYSDAADARGQMYRDGQAWLREHSNHAEAADLSPLWNALRLAVYEWVGEADNAAWWIDHRDDLSAQAAKDLQTRAWAIVKAFFGGADVLAADAEAARQEAEKQAQEEARLAEEKRIAAQARQEATVLAAQPVSKLVAEFTVTGGELRVAFPEKNDVFRLIMRGLGFEWSGTVWKRFHKDAAERAVEAAHQMLASGFSVRLFDPELRRRAIASEFTVENKHKAMKHTAAPYAGWFALFWPREDNLYDRLKRIKGTRWASKHAVVPPEQWEEVLDFCETHGFFVSVAAREIVETQKALVANALSVSVTPSPAPLPDDAADVPVLAVPETVEVPAHLRDED